MAEEQAAADSGPWLIAALYYGAARLDEERVAAPPGRPHHPAA